MKHLYARVVLFLITPAIELRAKRDRDEHVKFRQALMDSRMSREEQARRRARWNTADSAATPQKPPRMDIKEKEGAATKQDIANLVERFERARRI